jgi:hypothetical protein
MDTETPNIHEQHVGREPQWTPVQYIILTANAPNLIPSKTESGNRRTACRQTVSVQQGME